MNPIWPTPQQCWTTMPTDSPLTESSLRISASLKALWQSEGTLGVRQGFFHAEQEQGKGILSYTHFNILEIQRYAIRQERESKSIQTGRQKENYLWSWISDYLQSVKEKKRKTPGTNITARLQDTWLIHRCLYSCNKWGEFEIKHILSLYQ